MKEIILVLLVGFFLSPGASGVVSSKAVCATLVAGHLQNDEDYRPGGPGIAKIRERLRREHRLTEPLLSSVMSTITDFTRTFESTYRPMYTAVAAQANINYLVHHGMPLSIRSLELQLAQSHQTMESAIAGRSFTRALHLSPRDFRLHVSNPQLSDIAKNYDDLGLDITLLTLDAAIALNTEFVFRQPKGWKGDEEVQREVRQMPLLNYAANVEPDTGPGIFIPMAPLPGMRSGLLHEMTHFKNDSRWDYKILVDQYVERWRASLVDIRELLAGLLLSHPILPQRMENYLEGFRTRTLDRANRLLVWDYGNGRGLDRIDWYLVVNFQKALDEFEAHRRQGDFMRLEEGIRSATLLNPGELWSYLLRAYGPEGEGIIDSYVFSFLSPSEVQAMVDRLNVSLRPLALRFPAGVTETWQNELFKALLD